MASSRNAAPRTLKPPCFTRGWRCGRLPLLYDWGHAARDPSRFVRFLPAALEALVAMAFRSLLVSAFALAWPPRRPNSTAAAFFGLFMRHKIARLLSAKTMWKNGHQAGTSARLQGVSQD